MVCTFQYLQYAGMLILKERLRDGAEITDYWHPLTGYMQDLSPAALSITTGNIFERNRYFLVAQLPRDLFREVDAFLAKRRIMALMTATRELC